MQNVIILNSALCVSLAPCINVYLCNTDRIYSFSHFCIVPCVPSYINVYLCNADSTSYYQNLAQAVHALTWFTSALLKSLLIQFHICYYAVLYWTFISFCFMLIHIIFISFHVVVHVMLLFMCNSFSFLSVSSSPVCRVDYVELFIAFMITFGSLYVHNISSMHFIPLIHLFSFLYFMLIHIVFIYS